MSDSNPSKKEALEHEAQNYIRLGTLVRRARPDERAEAVAQVLADNVSIDEKIRRIERIDAARPAAEGKKPSPAPRASQSQAPSLVRSKQTVIAAARRRSRIKANIVPSTFMQYLLRESAEIRKRAKGNSLLKAGLFSVAMNEAAAREYFERAKRELVPSLLAALEAALREAWRFLRKSEYNRIAGFWRLVTELNNLELQRISPRDPSAARRLFALEGAFLLFRAEPSASAELVASLDEVLGKLSYPSRESEEAHSSARRLLQNGGPPVCLQDFILAFNMVRSRRFLSILDIMKVEAGPLLSLNEFDCTEGIQDRIDAHIASLVERLDKLGEDSEKVERLRTFVLRDKDGNIDYGPLALAYESAGEAGPSWERDQDNAILVATVLAERLIAIVIPVLGGAPPGAEVAKTAVSQAMPAARPVHADAPRIDDRALVYRVSLMQNVASKLRRMLVILPSLPQVRFMAIKVRAIQATKFDAEGAALIGEAADLFYMIGSRLADLLLSSDLFPVEVASDPFPAKIASDPSSGRVASDPPAASAAPQLGLPSLDNIALRQVLSSAATVAYLAALRFQESTIGAALKNERQAEDQKRDILGEIERLADADTFQEARKKAGLSPSSSG